MVQIFMVTLENRYEVLNSLGKNSQILKNFAYGCGKAMAKLRRPCSNRRVATLSGKLTRGGQNFGVISKRKGKVFRLSKKRLI